MIDKPFLHFISTLKACQSSFPSREILDTKIIRLGYKGKIESKSRSENKSKSKGKSKSKSKSTTRSKSKSKS